MSYLETNSNNLRLFLLFAIPSALIIAAVSGYDLSRRALSPVTAIMTKVESIGIGNLSQRIPIPPISDEIHQLAVSFNKLLERIEISVRANERFVANASHQIKTPLAILKGELELMRNKPRTDAEVLAFMTSASEEIEALSSLIEKLLVLASVDAGSQSLNLVVEPIDEIVLETMSRLKPIATAKNIVTKIDIMEGPRSDLGLLVRCDSGLLRTLFQSLIENALKYSHDNSAIEILIRSDDTRVSVDIVDHGQGIDPDVLPYIFDRFYRAPSSEIKTQGFGLGLAIAKRIVEIHGGMIEVSSEPNKETRFRVGIPLATSTKL